MGTVTSTIDGCYLFACTTEDDACLEDEHEYPSGTAGLVEVVSSLSSRTASLNDSGLDDQLGAVPMIGSLQEEIERIELEVW